jgi:ParB family chromosome partitioning protein
MSMELKELDPYSLMPNPWNSNKVARNEFEKLKKSLTKHTAFKPVIVRKLDDGTLEILGGYHRVEAAKELGWETIPTLILKDISDEQAKEISLIDNTRYGEDDKELLDKLLEELGDFPGLMEIIPETELIEMPEEVLILEELEEPKKSEAVEKDETHKVIKLRLEIDKAEEIEAILSKVAYDNDYKYQDFNSNFGDALYHILVLDK